MVSTANGNVKASLVLSGYGGTPVWGIKKTCRVCALGALGRVETTEQKVTKPVLSLLSSTLPPPREEAEETGGGAGCYRSPIGGTEDGPWGFLQLLTPS